MRDENSSIQGEKHLVFFLRFLSQAFLCSNEKRLFSVVGLLVSVYFATWLLSINKPPIFETPVGTLPLIDYQNAVIMAPGSYK